MVDVGLCKMHMGILTGCFQISKLSLNISQLLGSLGKAGEERGREGRRGEKRRGKERRGKEKREDGLVWLHWIVIQILLNYCCRIFLLLTILDESVPFGSHIISSASVG